MAKSFIQSLEGTGFWEKTAAAIELLIRKRTKAGKDVNGVDFKPYSKGYKRVREKKGRPIDPVDLVIDRQAGMIAQITDTVFDGYKGVEVYINSDAKEQLAIYHNIMGAGKGKVIREFWGLNDEEITKIIGVGSDLIYDAVDETIADNIVERLKKLTFDKNKN